MVKQMEDINNLKNNIIKELILDVEYAEFLCRQNLCDGDMIDLICCAPVPAAVIHNSNKHSVSG